MPDLLDTLELVRRLDRGSDADVVDLLDWLKVPDGWIQSTTENDAPVDEVLTLNIEAGSIDLLSAEIQAIDEKVKQVERSRQTSEPYGIWLRSQLAGETIARQAYLTRLKRSKQVRVSHPALWSNKLYQYQLGLTRMGAWEDTTATTLQFGTGSPAAVSAHGGALAYNLPGDMNARPALVSLMASGSSQFSEFWLGVKSEKYGGVDPSNFVPFWGADKAGYTWSDTIASSDATAVSGTKLTTDFSVTATEILRAAITVNAVTANVDDQRGKYIVLIRCKSSDASLVVNLRGGMGYFSGGAGYSLASGDSLQLSAFNTAYRYYSLGQFDLPPMPSLTDIDMDNATLYYAAEKVSGSGSLIVDGLLLIPAEHFIHVLTSSAIQPTDYHLYLIATPDLHFRAVMSFTTGGIEAVFENDIPDQLTWSLPPGAGAIICCASSTASAVTDALIPVLTIYPSYATLGGAG